MSLVSIVLFFASCACCYYKVSLLLVKSFIRIKRDPNVLVSPSKPKPHMTRTTTRNRPCPSTSHVPFIQQPWIRMRCFPGMRAARTRGRTRGTRCRRQAPTRATTGTRARSCPTRRMRRPARTRPLSVRGATLERHEAPRADEEALGTPLAPLSPRIARYLRGQSGLARARAASSPGGDCEQIGRFAPVARGNPEFMFDQLS